MRTLGDGGPEASVVGLGTNNFGARCDFEQSRAVLEAALEAGVTLVDTADIYSQGTSEEYIGTVLEGRLDRVVVATKFGKPMDGGPDLPRGSRDYIRWAVEGSLRRLRADAIDVYQMHEPDPRTPIGDTLEALHELVEEGVVRHVGSSNFSAEQIEEADRVARERGLTRFVAAQNHYSLVEREVEDEVLPACERLGIGMLPYFPLASGLLTGKYRRGEDFPEGSRFATMSYFASVANDDNFDRIEALTQFAEGHGHSLLELAIAWLAAQDGVGSVICGATTPEQVHANARAGDWTLTDDDLAAVP